MKGLFIFNKVENGLTKGGIAHYERLYVDKVELMQHVKSKQKAIEIPIQP